MSTPRSDLSGGFLTRQIILYIRKNQNIVQVISAVMVDLTRCLLIPR